MKLKRIILTLLIFFLTANTGFAAFNKTIKALKMEKQGYTGEIIVLLRDYDFTKDFLLSSAYERVYPNHLSFANYKLFLSFTNPNLTIYPIICNGPLLHAYIKEASINEAINFETNQIIKFEKPGFHLGYEYGKLANLHYRKGNYIEAFKYSKKAVVQNNRLSENALNTLLTLALKTNDISTASKILAKMEAYNIGKDIPVLLNSAYLKHKKYDYEEEKLDFRRILVKADISEIKAVAYYMLKEYNNALNEINNEVNSGNCFSNCYAIRSIIYRKLYQKKNSEDDYFRATGLDPNSYYALIAQYFFYKDGGNIEKAEETFNKFNNGVGNSFPLFYFYNYPTTITNVSIGVAQVFEDN